MKFVQTMCAENVVEGWEVFERWAKRFEKTALNNPNYSYCLSDANDIIRLFEEAELCVLDIEDISYPEYGERIIRHRIDFLRDYLVYISYDAGDFRKIVKRILAFQDPRRCRNGYAIWTRPYDYGNVKSSVGIHFRGFNAALFFEDYQDCEFGATMAIAPYELIFIRNKKGEEWSDKDARKFIEYLKHDLESDGDEIEISPYYGGGKFNHGPLICAFVKVK